MSSLTELLRTVLASGRDSVNFRLFSVGFRLSSRSVKGGLSVHSKYCSLLSDSVHSEVVSLHESMLSAESFLVRGSVEF